jgi:hypothetical protein
MADILLTTLSDALMEVAKTAPLKAATRAQADRTAAAIMQAIPNRSSARAGLIVGAVEDAIAARNPDEPTDFPWVLESDIDGVIYKGEGDTLGTAARALLTAIEAD